MFSQHTILQHRSHERLYSRCKRTTRVIYSFKMQTPYHLKCWQKMNDIRNLCVRRINYARRTS